MTRKMDKLQWTLDSFGEQLNDLSVDLRNEPDDVNVEHLVWLQHLEDKFQSLYWSLEKMKKSMAKTEEQRLLSLASCAESAEDIAVHLVRDNVRTALDSLLKSMKGQQEKELLGIPIINTHLGRRSPSINSNRETSSSVTLEGPDATGITIHMWGSTSEIGNESTP